MIGFDHRGYALPYHDFANLDWFCIGLPVVHSAAHVGIKREVLHSEQDLTFSRSRYRGFFNSKIAQLHTTVRPDGKDNLAGGSFGHLVSLSYSARSNITPCARRQPRAVMTRIRLYF
jgi:hypothetical protein